MEAEKDGKVSPEASKRILINDGYIKMKQDDSWNTEYARQK